MRRWMVQAGAAAVIAAVILAGARGIIPARAQDDAPARILAAYQEYEGWNSFRVQVSETSDYAATAQGGKTSLWQKRQRDLELSGSYDRGEKLVALDISSRVDSSTDKDGGVTSLGWVLDMGVAQVNGKQFGRGTYSADPPDDFVLPEEWTPFTIGEASDIAALADLELDRLLLQAGEPFVVDSAAWLDAAQSIDGPRPFQIDKTTSGDLYVLEVALADTPELVDHEIAWVEDRFRLLTDGPDAVADRAALLDSLFASSTVLWGVVIDPASGKLLAQYLQLDLGAKLDSAGLLSPYESLTLAYSGTQSVLFSAINEPVNTAGLPGQ